MTGKLLTKGADYWLVQRARRRDPDAWSTLWEANRLHLRNFLGRHVQDDFVLDDIEQATALQAWRKIHQFRGGCPFHYWLFSIAFNEFRMWLRRKKRHACLIHIGVRLHAAHDMTSGELLERFDNDDLESRAGTVEIDHIEQIEAGRTLRRISDKLRTMPAMYAETWRMRRLSQLTIAETSAITGQTEPAVKSRLHRACKIIAKVANG